MEHRPRYRYALVIHARRSVCECGHAFTLKREVRITASSPVKRKRALRYIKLHNLTIINPRRACAARVTVVVLCVCVCLSAPFRPLRVNVSPENYTNASSRQDKENKNGDFLKNAPFKSYGVICSLCRRSAVL